MCTWYSGLSLWAQGRSVPWNSNPFHIIWIWVLVSALLFFQSAYCTHRVSALCCSAFREVVEFLWKNAELHIYLRNLSSFCLFLKSVTIVPKSLSISTENKALTSFILFFYIVKFSSPSMCITHWGLKRISSNWLQSSALACTRKKFIWIVTVKTVPF